MKKARIIAIFILLTVLMYVYNVVQARYILNKNIQISYNTSDYYFDVSIDVGTISEFPTTINITTKNNNGTNYTDTDLIYTIGINNSNYTISTDDGKNTRTLAGGSKREETFAITINKLEEETDLNSKINLTFTVSKPYSDTINKEIEIQTTGAVNGAPESDNGEKDTNITDEENTVEVQPSTIIKNDDSESSNNNND